MRIEDYFLQVQKIVEACSVIQLSNVTYDKRGSHEGFIRGKLQFKDVMTMSYPQVNENKGIIDWFVSSYSKYR